MKKIGMIRVLTTSDEAVLYAHERLLKDRYNLEIETKCIQNQYEGIHSEELFRLAIPKIIELAKTFKDKDVILVSCCDDPGVEELKSIFPDKLIIGAGEATLSIARMYSDKIGVIGICDYLPRAFEPYSNKMSLVKPKEVDTTLDLEDRRKWEGVVTEAKKLENEGVGVIALACTGFATSGLTEYIQKRVGIKVIDPVMAQGLYAYYETKL